MAATCLGGVAKFTRGVVGVSKLTRLDSRVGECCEGTDVVVGLRACRKGGWGMGYPEGSENHCGVSGSVSVGSVEGRWVREVETG